MALTGMSLLINDLLLTGGDNVDIRERLWLVPRSYEDFVNYTAERMEENDDLRNVIINHMNSYPDANSGDIMEVLVNFLGLGGSLEIIDDEDEEDNALYTVDGMRTAL